MSKKSIEAGKKNLIPFDQRTKEEVKELNKKGGINSGIARRAKRDLQSVIKAWFDMPNADNPKITNREAVALKAGEQAVEGDRHAREWLGSYSGEKPISDEAEGFNKIADALRNANGRV